MGVPKNNYLHSQIITAVLLFEKAKTMAERLVADEVIQRLFSDDEESDFSDIFDVSGTSTIITKTVITCKQIM